MATSSCPLLARLGPRLRLLDVPTVRSTHAQPVPRVGGIGVLLGGGAGVGVAWLLGHGDLDAGGPWAPYLVPAGAFFLVGLADDRWGLRPRVKMPLQIAVAALAVALGLRWGGRAFGPFGAIELGSWTPGLTLLWVWAVVILVNFVDGIDLITCAVAVVILAAAAGGAAGPADGLLYAAALGAVLGLVVWNVTPARVFPGDAGTHLLGFLIATSACAVPSAGAAASAALPWCVVGAPLVPGVIDVALGLLGKARRGIPSWQAHSDHLYQRLTKVGWSHAAVAVRYGLLALLAVGLVGLVAPRLGLAPCVAVGGIVLAAHLGTGLLATRRVSWGVRAVRPGEER